MNQLVLADLRMLSIATPSEAADLLAKRAALGYPMQKEADIGETLGNAWQGVKDTVGNKAQELAGSAVAKQVGDYWNNNPALRHGLYGAGAGAGLGLLSGLVGR